MALHELSFKKKFSFLTGITLKKLASEVILHTLKLNVHFILKKEANIICNILNLNNYRIFFWGAIFYINIKLFKIKFWCFFSDS